MTDESDGAGKAAYAYQRLRNLVSQHEKEIRENPLEYADAYERALLEWRVFFEKCKEALEWELAEISDPRDFSKGPEPDPVVPAQDYRALMRLKSVVETFEGPPVVILKHGVN